MVSRSCLKTLGNIMVLSTVSLTSLLVGVTLGESISGRYESLEVSLGELRVKATGRNTTEVVTNLIQIANKLGMKRSLELY